MHEELLSRLCCPVCHGNLSWKISAAKGHYIETAEAVCDQCGNSYPVKEGIGIFLHLDTPIRDLWAQLDSRLIQYLHANPGLEQALMDSPINDLAPADQFFRAMALEARGDFVTAREIEHHANQGIYCPAYLSCWDHQVEFVIQQLSHCAGPIVDLASGRGYLAERIVRELEQQVVITDFSVQVLRGWKQRLEAMGLVQRASLLAFDARHVPFKERSIPTLVTNVGLPNIEDPGEMLAGLGRAVGGDFLAISHFYPPDDDANRKVIEDLGLSTFSYRDSTLGVFSKVGWQVEAANCETGTAVPTPVGQIIAGAGIDSLPVIETQLEWCTLVAGARYYDKTEQG